MIDNEDDIFAAIRSGLSAVSLDVEVFDQLILSPSVFPCVCVENIDNYTYYRTIDSGSNENHVRVAYEVNVYSNKSRDKRAECKRIFSVVSDVLTGLGFTRSSMQPIPLNESTAYRLVGRFLAVVDKSGQIARR